LLLKVIVRVIVKQFENPLFMRGLSIFKFEWHSRGQRFDPAYLHQIKNRIGMGFLPVSCGYFLPNYSAKMGKNGLFLRKSYCQSYSQTVGRRRCFVLFLCAKKFEKYKKFSKKVLTMLL